MSKQSLVITLVFAIAVFGIGFVAWDTATEPWGVKPGGGGQADFVDGFTVNESGFYFDGKVKVTLYGLDARFEHVMLCTYDDQQRVINATDLGTFSMNRSTGDEGGSVSATVHSDRVPTYILIYHPKFESYPDFGSTLYVRDTEAGWYRPTNPTSVAGFEYPPTEMIGVCR
ncbi:hypothetical protein [Haloferax sp. DFSO60]|uniref:hypothetical protein n=1 Tax=Haloferax sp. DFSO60 TaxID=3388652 RepID=UPI00397C8A0C